MCNYDYDDYLLVSFVLLLSAGLLDDEAPAVAASDQTRLTCVIITVYLCVSNLWLWLCSVYFQVCSRCDSPWEIATIWAGSVESLPRKCLCSASWDWGSIGRPSYCECVGGAVSAGYWCHSSCGICPRLHSVMSFIPLDSLVYACFVFVHAGIILRIMPV